MTDFARPLRIDQIRDGDRIDFVADDGERRDVARRLGLKGLQRLEAHAAISRTGELIRAKGRLMASLEQSCVVSGEPVAAHVDEAFEILFMPEPKTSSHDEEIELRDKDCDVVFHDGAVIALGDAIADTLALSVDPYPRSAGADAALKEAGILSEAEAGPFAALAKLKRSESD